MLTGVRSSGFEDGAMEEEEDAWVSILGVVCAAVMAAAAAAADAEALTGEDVM